MSGWENRISQADWKRLNDLMDFFGPGSYEDLSNLMLMLGEHLALRMLESCQQLYEVEKLSTESTDPAEAAEARKIFSVRYVKTALGQPVS